MPNGRRLRAWRLRRIEAALRRLEVAGHHSIPTYLYATLLSGQYAIPPIYGVVDAVYTNTAPVDAYRGAGRPEATFVVEFMVEDGGAPTRGLTRRSSAARNFITVVPAPDAGDHELRRRRL